MSSKKVFDTSTNVVEDINTDSGFLSGPCEQLFSGEIEAPEEPREEVSEKDKVIDAEPVQLDSGLDLCLSECLSSVSLSDVKTPTAQPPTITVVEEKSRDVPPLAFLFQQDDDGDTQLHIAAVHGCEKSVGTLVRVCPDKAWLDVPNDFGHTALHLAAMSGHAVITRMLVRAGATIGVRDSTGATPLHLASAAGHIESLQALLAPVPETPTRRLATALNQKNYEGQACVHLAAAAGNIEALQTLVFYGADINAREGLCGWTALHIAARRGDLPTALYLVDKCAGVEVTARDYAGRTPKRLGGRTAAAAAFRDADEDSETESEDDDDSLYDSDQSLFDKIREGMNAINVA